MADYCPHAPCKALRPSPHIATGPAHPAPPFNGVQSTMTNLSDMIRAGAFLTISGAMREIDNGSPIVDELKPSAVFDLIQDEISDFDEGRSAFMKTLCWTLNPVQKMAILEVLFQCHDLDPTIKGWVEEIQSGQASA